MSVLLIIGTVNILSQHNYSECEQILTSPTEYLLDYLRLVAKCSLTVFHLGLKLNLNPGSYFGGKELGYG